MYSEKITNSEKHFFIVECETILGEVSPGGTLPSIVNGEAGTAGSDIEKDKMHESRRGC